MADKTFDLDGADAAFKARKKALAEQRDRNRAETRNRIGDLAVLTGIPNGRTAENLAGCFVWAKQQAHANPALNKEWDRLGATFLGKSRGSRKDADASRSADHNSDGRGDGDAAPSPKGEPGCRADVGLGDLLARAAAE